MNGFVLDCSAAAAWCFEDEETEAAYALLKRAWSEPVFVPVLWHLEISNALIQAERRKRIDRDTMAIKIDLFDKTPFITDEVFYGESEKTSLIALARRENLTVYDAVYLDLALRKGLPLATLDKELRAAAARCGVPVLPDKL